MTNHASARRERLPIAVALAAAAGIQRLEVVVTDANALRDFCR